MTKPAIVDLIIVFQDYPAKISYLCQRGLIPDNARSPSEGLPGYLNQGLFYK